MTFDFDQQKTRDAFRLGLQSAVAAVLCYIVIQWMGSDEAFVAVLSAVLIVQPSIGRTVSAGWERLLATLVGSAIGLACLFLMPNAYGVAVALAVLMFVMNFIAGFRSNWRYGVVAAVALALADTTGDVDVAQSRAIAIGIGISIGIAVSFLVWPESAAKRALRHRRTALMACADRFEWALKDEQDNDSADKARQRFHDALSNGRVVADASKTADQDKLTARLDTIESLYNSIIFLSRVDSPLSRFDDKTISREELIESGRAAIEALAADNNDDTGDDEFEAAIGKVDDSLKARNFDDDETTGAASVVFGLREIKRCMDRVREAQQSAVNITIKARAKSAVDRIAT